MDQTQQHFAYRPDIDGLRAIAVLAVIAFHLGFASLAGGFLGVDIFFVISGYLITSIIAPKMAAGTFSFKGFYLKRIRRLVPPALVTIFATFIASAFILDPNDLIAMAKSAIAAVFSLSNFVFFSEAGYWDTQSELKPLLHTWSLGVEEQFYLFWPLLVFAFWRLVKGKGAGEGNRLRHLFWLFAIFTCLGLIISEWMLRLNASAAFYLLPARMFQFSIGACAAFFTQQYIWQKIANPILRLFVGSLGLIALFICIWLYRGNPTFPGMNALYPSIAVAMILVSGAKTQKFTKPTPMLEMVLGNPVMTFIGRISYSAYLVHWPVVSLLRYKVGLELSLVHQIFSALLIVLLTLLLYFGVEKRISARAGQKTSKITPIKAQPNAAFLRNLSIGCILACSVFFHAIMSSGWSWRFGGVPLTPSQIKAGEGARFSNMAGSCMIIRRKDKNTCQPNRPIQILVFGNSLEPDGYTFLQGAIGENPDVALVRFNQINRCNLIVEEGRVIATGRRKGCQNRLDLMMSSDVAREFDAILYIANNPFLGNKTGMLELLKSMKRLNPDIKIMTMGNYLNTKVPCSRLYNESGTLKSCADPLNVKSTYENDLLGGLRSDFLALTDVFIDRFKLLCGDKIPESCETATPEGVPLMYDPVHLSYEFALYSGQKYARDFPDDLNKILGVNR